MKINMKTASLLALIGTGLGILGGAVQALLSLLYLLGSLFGFSLPWAIMQLIGLAMWVITLVGLALMGTFFFTFWRKQE